MSIEVTIRQTGLLKKTLPLSVILGDELQYGRLVGERLELGVLAPDWFIAYNPRHMGRGFSVDWLESEKKQVYLRLPMPSTPAEIQDFYGAVERIASYWSCRLNVDGTVCSLAAFLAGYEDMVAFNERAIRQLGEEILQDGSTMTLPSALWPLSVGEQEATAFLSDPGQFAVWLHEKQTVDACYVPVEFCRNGETLAGIYLFSGAYAHIFPTQPAVPFGAMDPANGKPLTCTLWQVALVIEGREEPLGFLRYEDFLRQAPSQPFDSGHVLVKAMTREEMQALLASTSNK